MDGFLPTFIRRRLFPPRNVEKLFGQASQTFLAPKAVIVPMQDAPGDPYRSLVKARDEVAAGQKIGEKGAPPFAVSVRAPVSGKVREVESFPTPHGCHAAGVAIDSGGSQGPVPVLEVRGKKKETLLEAGIPLDYALLSGGKIDTLLVNGTEFEPFLSVRHQILKEKASQVMGGLSALMEIFSLARAIILVERKQSGLLRALGEAVPSSSIRIHPAGRSYPPDAAEAVFREAMRGRKGLSPEKMGLVELAFLPAVFEAVEQGTPFLERMVTVAGSAIREPRNLTVRLGTTFEEIIAHCGGVLDHVTQIVMGGALMGISQPTAQVPVTPKTQGILALVAVGLAHGHQSRMYVEGPCVRCAKCVDVCPVEIQPATLAAYCRKRRFEEASGMGLTACVDCGLCTYVCPARIPLAQILKEAKSRKIGAGSAAGAQS